MSAPVSQISAAVLPDGTEQLALVAPLCQHPDDAGASRLGMAPVLLEHEGEVLSDELRARDTTLARSPGEQPVVLWIEGDGRRFLLRECHKSNMTCREPAVKPFTHRKPLGSLTSNARLFHSVSCGSDLSVMPAFFARFAT